MSLALFFIGGLFVAAAVRDTQDDLFGLLKRDLTGPDNYVQWALALLLVGAIGYIPGLKGFSAAMLALILLAIFLRRGTGFFDQLSAATGVSKKHSDEW